MFELSKEMVNYILHQAGRQDELLYKLYRETHKKVLHPRML